jgi:HK97 gp10 family phage protein
MATVFKVEFEGFKETEELFRQISNDFGAKDASNILRNAVRKSMKPVLGAAKYLAPKDTGALAASLQVETRIPSKKDLRSRYVERGDAVIGLLTTASGKKLAKRKFTNIKTNKKESFNVITKQVNGKEVFSTDQRVAAMEFGTSKIDKKPFLIPALEMSSTVVPDSIGESLKFSLEKYKARQLKKVKT